MLKATSALLASSLVAALALSAPAHAVPEYFPTLLEQYRLVGDATAQGARCQYCHVYEDGSVPWNPFGDRVHAMLFDKANDYDIRKALYATLKQNADSDGDGTSDLLEVVAKTLPGDPNSKPKQNPADLQAALEKLGGVDAFKPR